MPVGAQEPQAYTFQIITDETKAFLTKPELSKITGVTEEALIQVDKDAVALRSAMKWSSSRALKAVIQGLKKTKGGKSNEKAVAKSNLGDAIESTDYFGPEMARQANLAGVAATTIRGVWDVEKGFVVSKYQHHTKITDTVSMSIATMNKKINEQKSFGGTTGVLCRDGKWRRAQRKRGKSPEYILWTWEIGQSMNDVDPVKSPIKA